jgi:hypothetical protein
MRFCAPAEPPTGHLQPPRAAALREPIIPYYPKVPTTNKYQRAKIKEQPGYRRGRGQQAGLGGEDEVGRMKKEKSEVP